MEKKALVAEIVFTGDQWLSPGVVVVKGDKIESVGKEVPSSLSESQVFRFPGKLLIPGGVNSHSHGFQILLRGVADLARNFRDWVDRFLYPLVLQLDESTLYWGSLLAFSEMALCGVTTVGEFYYIHNEKGSFRRLGNRLANQVIQAARDVGLRIVLLRTIYNRQEKEGQKRFFEPLEESLEFLRELRREWEKDPFVSVLPAPHSLHGATEEAIQASAEVAKEWQGKFHIHLAEEKHDIAFSQKLYGTTPLRALEKMGVLGRELVIVHGCHLEEEEIAMLGEAGGGLAYNPYSNMALGDGITKLKSFVERGVTVSLGTDGACANNRVDLFSEMRLAEYLQRVSRFEMNVLSPVWAEKGDSYGIFSMATALGGENLSLSVGRLAPGFFADLVLLDLSSLSFSPTYGGNPQVLYHQLLYSVCYEKAVTHVMVGGNWVVKEGRLCRMSEGEVKREVEQRVKHFQLSQG